MESLGQGKFVSPQVVGDNFGAPLIDNRSEMIISQTLLGCGVMIGPSVWPCLLHPLHPKMMKVKWIGPHVFYFYTCRLDYTFLLLPNLLDTQPAWLAMSSQSPNECHISAPQAESVK